MRRVDNKESGDLRAVPVTKLGGGGGGGAAGVSAPGADLRGAPNEKYL